MLFRRKGFDVATLVILPNQEFVRRQKQETPPPVSFSFSLASFVSFLLKEKGVVYREDPNCEEMVIWEGVWEHGETLQSFAALLHYPGFIQEMRLLYRMHTTGELELDRLKTEEQAELTSFFSWCDKRYAELSVLLAPSQMKLAKKVSASSPFLQGIEVVEVYPLGELSPLERGFLDAICQGKEVRHRAFPRKKETIRECFVARDPKEEVHYVAKKIREKLQRGVLPKEIALGFPLEDYLPLVERIFSGYGIPFRVRPKTLWDTPLFKRLFHLLRGVSLDFDKHHLELVVADNWGYFGEKGLRFSQAPKIRALKKWKEIYPEDTPSYALFRELEALTSFIGPYSLSDYSQKVGELLREDETTTLQEYLQLEQAKEGLRGILSAFSASLATEISLSSFLGLWESRAKQYTLAEEQHFTQEVSLYAFQDLLGHPFSHIFLLGLTEGNFPRVFGAHWLTRQSRKTQDASLFESLLSQGEKVSLSYPRSDKEGKPTLPSPLLPSLSHTLLPKMCYEKRPGTPLDFKGGVIPSAGRFLEEEYKKHGISVSKLNLYQSCPFRFFCQEVLHLAEPLDAPFEITAKQEGTLLHKVLQIFWQNHREGSLPKPEDAAMEGEEIASQLFSEEGIFFAPHYKKTLRLFLRKDIMKLPPDFRPYLLEESFNNLPFFTPFGMIMVRGILDRIDIDPLGRYLIYDYKTGMTPSIRDVKEGNHVQLVSYVVAAEGLVKGNCAGAAFYSIGERSIKGIFQKEFTQGMNLRSPNQLDKTAWEAFLTQGKAKIQEILTKMLTGEFPVAPLSLDVCAFCGYLSLCRKEGTT